MYRLVLAVLLVGCLQGTPIQIGELMPPGSLVRGDTYTEWVIEVDYATGSRPSDASLGFVKNRLTPLVDKPDGVSFLVDDALPATSKTWTTDQLVALASSSADVEHVAPRAVTHLLLVRGDYEKDDGDSRILGFALGHSLVVLFVDSIEGACTLGLPFACDPELIFKAVLIHEMGHILGLVNNGTPMTRPHEDPEHLHHSSNQDSVMYWAIESTASLPLLGGGPPTEFDSNDKADLAAVRNG